AQMAGRRDPAFLVAGQGGVGFESMARAAGSLRQQLGPIGVSAGIENGDVIGRRDPLLAGLQGYRRSGYDRASFGVDTRWRGLATGITASRLAERDTLLGARFDGSLGAPQATSWFLDMDARADLGRGWTVGGNWRRGWTRAAMQSGLAGSGRLSTAAFAFDAGKDGVLGSDS
ncbi:hypothetical protein NY536_02250, partial [Enterobacter hormaechei]|nr:hypothetical protein [Enterobacter hormaechei]